MINDHYIQIYIYIYYTLQCEPKCHRGLRNRTVHCEDRVSRLRLSDNRCTAPKPQTMEQCVNAGPCFTTPQWQTGNWTKVNFESCIA